jgi:hypothetical protein
MLATNKNVRFYSHVVSYSKAFKKEAEILKIDLFSTLKKSPNSWRYFRYEEE